MERQGMENQENLHISSRRFEQLLKVIVCSAKPIEREISGTSKGDLCGIEVTGALASLSRKQFLCIAFYGGFASDADFYELALILWKDNITKSPWFNGSIVSNSDREQKKINGMLNAVLNDSLSGRTSHTAHISEQMGITKQAYNKTWKLRYTDIKKAIDFNIMAGVARVHIQLAKR
jgi:hypothetical protein